MVTSSCWELNILGKCSRVLSGVCQPSREARRRPRFSVLLSFLLLCALILSGAPRPLYASAASAHKKKTKQTTAPKAKAVGGTGLIAAAQRQLTQGNYATASQYAKEAGSKVPLLEDYAEYIREQAEYNLKNYA